MSNATLMVMSWCPGDKCDPCKITGDLELIGNLAGHSANCSIGGAITSFPEFPFVVNAEISLQGTVSAPTSGSGSLVTITGQGNGPGPNTLCPFPSTMCNSPAGWNVNGSDLLLFRVKASCNKTSAAWLQVSTVDIIFHPKTGNPYPLLFAARWTGDVS